METLLGQEVIKIGETEKMSLVDDLEQVSQGREKKTPNVFIIHGQFLKTLI